jgi:hypothetical protein
MSSVAPNAPYALLGDTGRICTIACTGQKKDDTMTLMAQGRDRSRAHDEVCQFCARSEDEAHLVAVPRRGTTDWVCEVCLAQFEREHRDATRVKAATRTASD